MNKSTLKGFLIITLTFLFSYSINAECTKDEILQLVNAGYNKTEISALCEKQDGSNEVSIKSAGEEPEKPKNPIKELSINSDDKGPKIIAKEEEYVKYENGIVYDKKSGLEWVAGPDKHMGGYAAKKWVNNLNLDGGGWRMPSTRELEGIYKLGAGTRNMTSLLKTSGWFVWSSAAGGFSFSSGNFGNYGTSNVCRAFAVRGEGVGYLSKKPDKTEPIHNDRGMKSELDQQKENSNIKQDLKKAGETLLDIGEIVLPLLQWFW